MLEPIWVRNELCIRQWTQGSSSKIANLVIANLVAPFFGNQWELLVIWPVSVKIIDIFIFSTGINFSRQNEVWEMPDGC